MPDGRSESLIHVFVEPDGRQPLFRYEFNRSYTGGSLPSAHIQFHGQHPELAAAMQDAGESTGRAKACKHGKCKVYLHDLHFPAGGPRFRPVLEDVLEMLSEEFGVKPVRSVPAARKTLADAREAWRRKRRLSYAMRRPTRPPRCENSITRSQRQSRRSTTTTISFARARHTCPRAHPQPLARYWPYNGAVEAPPATASPDLHPDDQQR